MEIRVKIPEEKWFSMDGAFLPKDKDLCVVLNICGLSVPEIVQYREADALNPKGNYFLAVGDMWTLDTQGVDVEPTFLSARAVNLWRPLGLPQEEDRRVKEDIEQMLGQ